MAGIIVGLLIVSLFIWILYRLFVPNEIPLMGSDSSNNINKIEIVRIEDFLDPTLTN